MLEHGDFVADKLFSGQRFRALTVVDNYGRESLAILVDTTIRADDLVSLMKHLKSVHGRPQRIQVDNGSQLISKVLDLWAYENDLTLIYSSPGIPTDNPYIESFNSRFRDDSSGKT